MARGGNIFLKIKKHMGTSSDLEERSILKADLRAMFCVWKKEWDGGASSIWYRIWNLAIQGKKNH